MTADTIILIITATATALIAGLFYSYSCSVNPGLAQLPDREYLLSMKSINKAILNPLFFATFLGTLILLPVSTYLNYGTPAFALLLIASLVYGLGVFGITIFANVPLNESLAAFSLKSASAADMAKQRAQFEMPWNKWHMIRSIASVVALVMAIIACIRK